MRILFVDHTSLVSGAQHSLFELLGGLVGRHEVAVACADGGPFAAALRSMGVTVLPIPETHGSFRLHPVHTPRALADLARMARAVREHAARFGADVVHANSVRSGLVCALAFGPRRRGRRTRVVTHVRDSIPHTPAGRAVRGALRSANDVVIAISRHTARTFGPGPVVVIHNCVDLERFAPDGPRAEVGGDGPLLGVFGQITPWKGQDDAIRALPVGARLIVVGEAKFVSAATRYDNRAFEQELHELAAGRPVAFLGQREDVAELMRACDLVLVPSWEEPFGRVVIEAMACGTPVLATNRGGPPEVVDDGVDGRLLPPRSPDAWRAAAEALLADEAALAAMGRAAVAKAGRFGREAHVEQVLDAYRQP